MGGKAVDLDMRHRHVNIRRENGDQKQGKAPASQAAEFR